jgi:cytochrome bd-type quinol oxidase subunit 1
LVILAFGVSATITYPILWHVQGMDKVTADDNPGVVLGAFWCMGWSVVTGLIAAAICALYLILRTREHTKASVP